MIIDKPLSWTSFDVVNKVRYALRGFTESRKSKSVTQGTLDPLATGVCSWCVAPCDQNHRLLQAQAKVYTATIRTLAHTPSLMLRPKLTGGPPTQTVLSLTREKSNGQPAS